jgi:hypothetical protein
VFRPVERSFAVDEPFGAPERRKVAKEGAPGSQRFEGGKGLQLAGIKGAFYAFITPCRHPTKAF